jgi:hypothetical protein
MNTKLLEIAIYKGEGIREWCIGKCILTCNCELEDRFDCNGRLKLKRKLVSIWTLSNGNIECYLDKECVKIFLAGYLTITNNSINKENNHG